MEKYESFKTQKTRVKLIRYPGIKLFGNYSVTNQVNLFFVYWRGLMIGEVISPLQHW